MNTKKIITIDGPAGSGKSSTSKRVASELGYTYLDSGSMYRAVTLKVLELNINPQSDRQVQEIAEKAEIELISQNGQNQILLDGKDVTSEIREPKISKTISSVAANKGVRSILAEKQKEIGKYSGIVAEGRDMGTVVFPDADLKIYMTASIQARAERRYKQLLESGIKVDLDKLISEIRERDKMDSTRKHSPLRQADDSIILDTSNMSLDDQVNWIVDKAKALGANVS
ncbi:MAG: (d)CMP kinase [candidate division KSB1 bacterium]|nr:(d)CMP kinase [candidate division KSB1 bacterium]